MQTRRGTLPGGSDNMPHPQSGVERIPFSPGHKLRIAPIAILGVLIVPAGARAADHCSVDASAAGGTSTLAVRMATEAASYTTKRFEGDYAGVSLGVDVAFRRGWARAALGGYRLNRNGAVVWGIGDLLTEGGWAVIERLDLAQLRLGIAFGLTLPTGDKDRSLGMGHAMAMPRLWARARVGMADLAATLGYGRALPGGASGHAGHGAGGGPIVDPMGSSEAMGGFNALLAIADYIGASARASFGLPLPNQVGTRRLIVGGGARLGVGRAVLDAHVDMPVVGSPFEGRFVLGLVTRY